MDTGVSLTGHEADHSSPSSAKDKNEQSNISTPLYEVCFLDKHWDSFIFTLRLLQRFSHKNVRIKENMETK
jgi:hypothetical protein